MVARIFLHLITLLYECLKTTFFGVLLQFFFVRGPEKGNCHSLLWKNAPVVTRLISNKAKIFIISQAHASIFSVLFSLIMMHLSFFSVAAQTTEGQVELESLFLPFFSLTMCTGKVSNLALKFYIPWNVKISLLILILLLTCFNHILIIGSCYIYMYKYILL